MSNPGDDWLDDMAARLQREAKAGAVPRHEVPLREVLRRFGFPKLRGAREQDLRVVDEVEERLAPERDALHPPVRTVIGPLGARSGRLGARSGRLGGGPTATVRPMFRGGPRNAGRGLLGACAVEVSRQRNFQRDRQVALGACAVEVSRQRNFQRDRQVALGPRQKFRWTSTPMTRGLPHAPNFPPLNAPEL